VKVIKGGKDKPKRKTKRKHFDREAICKQIAAGMLTFRQIAKKHGCSPAYVYKLKVKEGIERDLTKRVRQSVQAKLVNKKQKSINTVHNKTKKEQEQFESEAIEEAAKVGVEIISRHREVIERCRTVANKFLAELEKDKACIKVTNEGKKVYAKIPIAQKSALYNAVTMATSRLVPLERQAYNLDAETPKTPTGEGDITAFPSGPLTLSEWETQMKEAEENREKTNDTGN